MLTRMFDYIKYKKAESRLINAQPKKRGFYRNTRNTIEKLIDSFQYNNVQFCTMILKTIVRIVNKPTSFFSWTQGGYDICFAALQVSNEKIRNVAEKIGNAMGFIGFGIMKFRK